MNAKPPGASSVFGTPPRRLMAIGIAAALTALALPIIVVLIAPPRSSSPNPVEPTATATAPAAAPTMTGSVSPNSGSSLPAWAISRLPEPVRSYGGPWPRDAVAGGPGYVTVGSISPCCADVGSDDGPWMSVIWTSADGLDWHLVDDLESFGPSGLTAVASDETGTMVAVGYEVLPPATGDTANLYATSGRAWRSTNGIDWFVVETPDGTHADVAATSEGWYIGGASGGQPVIWHSSDLDEWTAAALGGTGQIEHLAVGAGGRIVAVGCVGGPPEVGCESVAWVASAGTNTWQRASEPMRSVSDVVGWRDGFVAIGANPDSSGAASWISSDGLRWETGHVINDAGGWTLLALDDTLLLGGEVLDPAGNFQPGLWASTDGLAWRAAASLARLPSQSGGRLSVLMSSDHGLTGLGAGFADGSGVALLWRESQR